MIKLFPVGHSLQEIALPEGMAWMPENSSERPDAFVVLDQGSLKAAIDRLPGLWLSILPIIACDQVFQECADLLVEPNDASLADAVIRCKPMIERASRLDWEKIGTGGSNLLAYLFVRDSTLTPKRNLHWPQMLDYAEVSRFPEIESQAEGLAGRGLLAASHHETVNDCHICGSARILVREVCATCGSSDIVDEVVLHHFDCAYQGPESDFRTPDGLRCPKCRQFLQAFSVDYDKSATVSLCHACQHTSQDADVGFRCLDCEEQANAGRLIARRLFSYRLTEAAKDLIVVAAMPQDMLTIHDRTA